MAGIAAGLDDMLGERNICGEAMPDGMIGIPAGLEGRFGAR